MIWRLLSSLSNRRFSWGVVLQQPIVKPHNLLLHDDLEPTCHFYATGKLSYATAGPECALQVKQ